MTRFCVECGSENTDVSKFCHVCGASIKFDTYETTRENYGTPQQASGYSSQALPPPIAGHQQPYYGVRPFYYEYSAINIVKGVVNSYTRLFKPIILTYVAFIIIMVILSSALISYLINLFDLSDVLEDPFISELVPIIIGYLAIVFFGLFKWMPDSVTYRLVSNFEEQREENYVESVSYAISRWPQIIFLILIGISIFITSIIAIIVITIIAITNEILFILTLIIGVIFFAIYTMIRLSLSSAFIVIDGYSAIDAVKESWEIMNGKMLSLIGASIIVSIASSVISYIFQRFTWFLFSGGSNFEMVASITLPQIIIAPFTTLLYISAYYLIRMNAGLHTNSKIFT